MQYRGLITDRANNTGLPLANVYFSDKRGNIEPSNIGTISDYDGFYNLEGQGQYLTASYTGYNSQTVKLNGSFVLNFQLTQGLTLKEFEVVGLIWWPRIAAALVLILLAYWLINNMKNK